MTAPLLLMGCSTIQKSPVPRSDNEGGNRLTPGVVPLSGVVDALRGELASAFAELHQMKLREPENRALEGLIPSRKGSLSGEAQVVQSDSGSIMAVIPSTGYVGSLLGPERGLSSTATSIQSVSLSFSVDPPRFWECGAA